ncbi:Aste57867_7814 [Aphanomyces stellatus]|uniref:Aste57867_7814 protein n=1 Tax=Aphanomyces stellatus TaxID=120398 RepID=A0A485KIT6_9STRA|nr:hypothetical protein As57867_007784 [Aphanomyces stellatus]VFT84711.1 Aste57867_7814 [Aphanomyces stellatus]
MIGLGDVRQMSRTPMRQACQARGTKDVVEPIDQFGTGKRPCQGILLPEKIHNTKIVHTFQFASYPQVKIKKASSAAALKMSKQASNPLRETITPAPGSDGPTPGIGVSTNPGQEVGFDNALLPNPGVSNTLLTPNPSSVSVLAGGAFSSDSPRVYWWPTI